MADFAEFNIDGKKYAVNQSDFTMGRMRHAKQWFGAEYGEYLTLLQKFMRGDADAVAFVVWIAMKVAGENPVEPRYMDYAVGDIIMSAADEAELAQEVVEKVEEAQGENPTRETSPPSKGSKRT